MSGLQSTRTTALLLTQWLSVGCLTIDSSWSSGKRNSSVAAGLSPRATIKCEHATPRRLECRTSQIFVHPNRGPTRRVVTVATRSKAEHALVFASGFICVPSSRGPLCGFPSRGRLRRVFRDTADHKWAIAWPEGLCATNRTGGYDCLIFRTPGSRHADLLGVVSRVHIPAAHDAEIFTRNDGFCACSSPGGVDHCLISSTSFELEPSTPGPTASSGTVAHFSSGRSGPNLCRQLEADESINELRRRRDGNE